MAVVMKREREAYWDALKYILIGLVVCGHFLELNNPEKSINRVIFNYIYLFHMPLFVFISGRFSQITDRIRYRRGIISLLETLFVFQIFATILFKRYSIIVFFAPWFHLWYLLTIIYYRLFIYLAPPSHNNKSFIIILSFVISVLGGFVPVGRFLSIQRALTFFPFFVLGYYSYNVKLKEHIKEIPFILAVGSLLLIFGLVYLFFDKDITRLLIGADPYYAGSIKETMGYFFHRIVYLSNAIVLSIMVMRIVPENKIIAKFGKGTMVIFVFHVFVLYLFKYAISHFSFPGTGPWVIMYAVITLLFLTFLSNCRFTRVLLNPVSLFMKECLNSKDSKRQVSND